MKKNNKDIRAHIWIFYIFIVALIFFFQGITYGILLTTLDSSNPLFQQTINRIIICVLYFFMALVSIHFKYTDLKIERKPDIPIDVIGFEQTNIIRDVIIAIILTSSLIFISNTMKMAMIGVPGAVTGIMAFGGTAKLILTMAVAPIENVVIAGILPVSLLAWITHVLNKYKMKNIFWLGLATILCSCIGGGLGVVLHSIVYPATMAYVQLATFFFFSLGTFAVLTTKSMLSFDLTHIWYNLLVAFVFLWSYTFTTIF